MNRRSNRRSVAFVFAATIVALGCGSGNGAPPLGTDASADLPRDAVASDAPVEATIEDQPVREDGVEIRDLPADAPDPDDARGEATVPDPSRYCLPCRDDSECSESADPANWRCIPRGDGSGSFCGNACATVVECPDGAACAAAPSDGATFCQPSDGACGCSSLAIELGASTACVVANAAGTCFGARACSDTGLAPCSAALPAPETCNDVDDDCDGQTDEDFVSSATACGAGACAATGQTSCTGGTVVDSCVPGVGTVETCNGIDDDCDGQTDDGQCFIDGICHADGAPDPAGVCRICAVARNRTAWTNRDDGEPCGSGFTCQSGTCTCAGVLGFLNETVPVGGDVIVAGVGEFTGDGHPDLVTALPDGSLVVVPRNGPGWGIPVPVTTAGWLNSIQVGDLDGDGRDDMALALYDTNTLMVVRIPDGLAAPVVASYEIPWYLADIALADLDGDGDLDVATGSGPSVLANDGQGAFGPPAAQGDWMSQSIAVGDLDGDGIADLVVGYGGPAAILVGRGDGTFEASVPLSGSDGVQSVALADVSGDGHRDILLRHGLSVDSGRTLQVWLNDGTGHFATPAATHTLDSHGENLVIADVNGDGKADIVAPLMQTDSVAVLLGRGDGTFAGPANFAAGMGPQRLTAADIDGSGRVALVVGNNCSCDALTILRPTCTPAPACNDDNPCTNDAWAPLERACTAADAPDGTDCGDGRTCHAGVCCASKTFYRDADGDGYGLASDAVMACSVPAGYAVTAGDCDDTDAGTHPGASESCNGRDDDCNGLTDQQDPSMAPMYCEKQQGVCNGSTKPREWCGGLAVLCDDTTYLTWNSRYRSATAWGSDPCDGLDNDCDGATDETPGLIWNENQNGACYGTVYKCHGIDGMQPDYSSVPLYGKYEAPDASFLDENCDGIDGTESAAVFVATTGDNSGDCTRAAPCLTINAGLAKAASLGRTDVYVQAGVYLETVVLRSGIRIFGGYDTAWMRGPRTTEGNRVTVQGEWYAKDSQFITVVGHNVTASLVDIVLVGPTATGQWDLGHGRSSYTVHLDHSTVTLERVDIVAGNGSAGSEGTPGADAYVGCLEGPASCRRVPGDPGYNGTDAARYAADCDDWTQKAGGAGGTAGCQDPGTAGATGGIGGRMDTKCSNGQCDVWPGDCSATAGEAGGGGCAHRVGGPLPGGAGGGPQQSGGTAQNCPGSPLLNGTGGIGASGIRGSLVNGLYWKGSGGTAGTVGVNGGGGPGGGGSGGSDAGMDSVGAGGGGGGAGGCRAPSAGGGGYSGGSSFGIAAMFSTLTIRSSMVMRGTGGAGGAGGTCGQGQDPGATDPSLGNGGKGDGNAQAGGSGGNGEHGGHSGGGGGGQGGLSVGILLLNTNVTSAGNTIAGGTEGVGGDGGGRPWTLDQLDVDDGNYLLGGSGRSGSVYDILECGSSTYLTSC